MMSIFRNLRVGAVAVLALALTSAGYSATANALAIRGTATGGYHSSRMTIEVALAPRDPAGLNRLLRAQYTPHSGSYHRWLATGQFDARFAPTRAMRTAVSSFLTRDGLRLRPGPSPFLIRAVGTSQQVSAAFGTRLATYRGHDGAAYFANATPVRLPARLAPGVLGVLGLADTLHMRPGVALTRAASNQAATAAGLPACENAYPTPEFLLSEIINGTPDTAVPRGYGGGPGCSGLTPAQVNSIYGAPAVGPRGKGAGVTMAVFELSGYQQSDITTWARTFYGASYSPPLREVDVDGGPVNPACPAGDLCVPGSDAYYADDEVAADIEMALTIAPAVRQLEVYNAPNDSLGITEMDEYAKIAADDSASVISSSWGICENDAGVGYEQAQNTIFEQMAAQGQSMFAATGDTGAFGCIRSDGTAVTNVLDPAAQPWVTAVGGTSFETFDPGADPTPGYPTGVETVWNVDNLCNTGSDEGLPTDLDYCAVPGAGGGGSSEVFGRPFYQHGLGVDNPDTTTGCALAAAQEPCREIPDVSANADVFTPYAAYCTGNASTPGSFCGTFTGADLAPGWVGSAGTSVSTPLWAGIFADRDSYQGFRTGNANPLLYLLYNLAPRAYFHDITADAAASNNGLFPASPGYDLATGIGTPKMAALITGTF
jgi:subtilase family serine protease